MGGRLRIFWQLGLLERTVIDTAKLRKLGEATKEYNDDAETLIQCADEIDRLRKENEELRRRTLEHSWRL